MISGNGLPQEILSVTMTMSSSSPRHWAQLPSRVGMMASRYPPMHDALRKCIDGQSLASLPRILCQHQRWNHRGILPSVTEDWDPIWPLLAGGHIPSRRQDNMDRRWRPHKCRTSPNFPARLCPPWSRQLRTPCLLSRPYYQQYSRNHLFRIERPLECVVRNVWGSQSGHVYFCSISQATRGCTSLLPR